MTQPRKPIALLSELADGQDADFFALLAAKDLLKTRDGKPYFRVTFEDAARQVTFPVWNDTPWSEPCRDTWTVGEFYKLRACYRETSYGPQLEIQRIRPVVPEDASDGFDRSLCVPHSRFDPQEMFDEILQLVKEHLGDAALQAAVLDIYQTHREELLLLPAATRNHHAYLGGFLEHVLSVTRNGLFLAERYAALYPKMRPPLSVELVVAGCLLHDIGKLRELDIQKLPCEYTPAGSLIGHVLQGRDLLREFAGRHGLDQELQLRLEHIIVSHQRLPEWGSPKPPMIPEALLVHFADDTDAKFNMMYEILRTDAGEGMLTSRQNALRYQIYRGETQD